MLCRRLHAYSFSYCLRASLRHIRSDAKEANIYDISKIRNVGIIAHIDAGKTTVTERMLYYSGASRSLGNVCDGNTVTDFMDQERERGITITSAAVNFLWKEHKINLIDTPGHIDFTCEVESALRVLDGAILVLDASAGVEAQTLSVWKQALKYKIPQIAFINKMDKKGASFEDSIDSITKKLGRKPLSLQLPILSDDGKTFNGVVDLVRMLKCKWGDIGDGSTYQKTILNPNNDKLLHEEACAERIRLLEELADIDEIMADHYLEDYSFSKISQSEIVAAIKRVTVSCQALPVVCGSALKNKGVQRLMNSINMYLPDPQHNNLLFNHKNLDQKSALTFAFKIMHDEKKRPITLMRIYSGQLTSGASIYNATKNSKEKIETMYQINANEFEPITKEYQGNIVAVTGLKDTHTGDILVTGNSSEELFNVADIPGIQVPEPVYFCSVEPPTLSAQKTLDEALQCLTREDPSLRVRTDQFTGQTILSGMGELHMEIIKDRILKEYKVDVDLGSLQIAYQETINDFKKVHVVFKKHLGDINHEVEVVASFHPVDLDKVAKKTSKFSVVPDKESELAENGLKPKFIKAIEDGLANGFSRGPLLGYPISNVHMELHEFKTSSRISMPVISSCIAKCVKEALTRDNAVLLQPVMEIEIFTTTNVLGFVLSDLSQRESAILNVVTNPNQDSATVHARAPLANLNNFSTSLRTKTSGLVSFNLNLSNYERVSEKSLDSLLKSSGFA